MVELWFNVIYFVNNSEKALPNGRAFFVATRNNMKWNSEDINMCITLYKGGCSFLQISQRLGRTRGSIIAKLKKLGYKGRDPNRSNKIPPNKGKSKYNSIDWKFIQSQYDSGMSYEDLIRSKMVCINSMHWAIHNGKMKMRSFSEGVALAWKNGKYKASKKQGLDRYRQLCEFKFSIKEYPNKFDFKLIEKHGWYKAKNRGDNPNGVSRDHKLSVKSAFEMGILPYYVSHPANCELMLQSLNSKKKSKCSISFEELVNLVEEWDLESENANVAQ